MINALHHLLDFMDAQHIRYLAAQARHLDQFRWIVVQQVFYEQVFIKCPQTGDDSGLRTGLQSQLMDVQHKFFQVCPSNSQGRKGWIFHLQEAD